MIFGIRLRKESIRKLYNFTKSYCPIFSVGGEMDSTDATGLQEIFLKEKQ